MIAEDVKQAYQLAKYRPTVYQVKFYKLIPEKKKLINTRNLVSKVMVLCMN